MDARFAASLKKLDPETRLEQVCDLEAMSRIDRDASPFIRTAPRPMSSSHPKHVGDTVKGSGGAFRSKGHWYSFSFECKGTPDHMKVSVIQLQDRRIDPRIEVGGLWACGVEGTDPSRREGI